MDLFGAVSNRPPGPRREVLDYLEVPLRRPLLVIVPTVLLTAAAVATSFVVPERYRSSTLILMEWERIPDSFVRKVDTQSARSRLSTVKQEILSRTRLERVVAEVKPRSVEGLPLGVAVSYLRGCTEINVRGNDAFTIEFVDRDPQQAMLVANRLATLFIEEAMLEKKEKVEEATDFLESQLQEARKALEVREAEVAHLKRGRMGSLPEQMSANLAILQRLQLEHQTTSDSLQKARERQLALEKGLSDQILSTSAPGATRPDPLTELSQLRAELETLRGRYTDEHPDVKVVLARIRRLESAPAGESLDPSASASASLRVALDQAKRDVTGLEAKLADLSQRIGSYQDRVEAAPRVEQEIANLTRDLSTLRQSYLTLLGKKMDAEMAERLETRWKGETFRILDPAHAPERPYFPNRYLFFALGLIGGLVAGLAAAFALEAVDHSIKDVPELERAFELPVLAVLPRVGSGSAGRHSSRYASLEVDGVRRHRERV